jgi:hypothetical protein
MMMEPRGAVEEEALGIGIPTAEFSCGSDLKKVSSFFE